MPASHALAASGDYDDACSAHQGGINAANITCVNAA